jgi:hypothetical protein
MQQYTLHTGNQFRRRRHGGKSGTYKNAGDLIPPN